MADTNHSPLRQMVSAQKQGKAIGITSICSANSLVLEASFTHALAATSEMPLMIESTCNQVNQYGGYTGQTPAQFMTSLEKLATSLGFPRRRLVVGGDHLGPSPWQNEPAAQAMAKARRLVGDYVRAGYTKIHLDASMKCADDDPARPLPIEVAARRSAELAQAAEMAHRDLGSNAPPLFYVIGSEVPTPGGSLEQEESLVVTSPDAAAETIEATRLAFRKNNLDDTWQQVIALVVQPGVEFGDDSLFPYDRESARPLTLFIEDNEQLIYEAHSTDYQTPAALRQLVEDHFAILKVGPALTFAKREAVFALAIIEEEMLSKRGDAQPSQLPQVLEKVMQADPIHWRKHYQGTENELGLARKYSYSDRIRYYWAVPKVEASLQQLWRNLSAAPLPLTLLSQYLPVQYKRIRDGRLANTPFAIAKDKIWEVLDDYAYACGYTL